MSDGKNGTTRLFTLYRLKVSLAAATFLTMVALLGLSVTPGPGFWEMLFSIVTPVMYLPAFIMVFVSWWVLENDLLATPVGMIVFWVVLLVGFQATLLYVEEHIKAVTGQVILPSVSSAIVAVITFRFWALWLPGSSRDQRSVLRVLVETGLVVVTLTIAFATWTAVLEAQNLVQTRPGLGNHPIQDMENYYAREFLGSIPELEIPRTVNWDAPFRVTDTLGGVLLIVYKLLVIIPVVIAIADLWRRGRGSSQTGNDPAHERTR